MSYTTEVTRAVPFSAVSTKIVAAADNNELFTTIQNTTTGRNVSGSVIAAARTQGAVVTESKDGYAKIKIPFPFDQLPEEYVDLELLNVRVTTIYYSERTGTIPSATSGSANAYAYLCKDTTQKGSAYLIASGITTTQKTINMSGQGWSKNDILDDQMYLYVRGHCTANARYISGIATAEVGLDLGISRSNNIIATWACHVSPPTINGEPIIITTTL